MLPGKKTIIIITFFFIVILAIALLIMPAIFRTDNNPPPQPLKKPAEMNRTTHTNVTKVFFDIQTEKTGLLQKNLSERYEMGYVPPETAKMHAEVELARVLYTTSRGLAGTNFSEVALYKDPVIVYDDSGTRQQYYKFYAGTHGFKNILLMTPASKIMGYCCGIPALGSSDDNSNWFMLQKAQEFYDVNYSGSDIISVKLIASACFGEIIKLDLVPLYSMKVTTLYLDYGSPRNQETCERWVNASKQAIPDRIAEWEMSDTYFRSIHDKALAEGINLTEPCSWEKKEKMESIFQSQKPPLTSPR